MVPQRGYWLSLRNRENEDFGNIEIHSEPKASPRQSFAAWPTTSLSDGKPRKPCGYLKKSSPKRLHVVLACCVSAPSKKDASSPSMILLRSNVAIGSRN